jgi:hypothetical protein
VELLSSLRDRRRLVKAARRDGRAARRAARAFQLAATELAFRRRRAARGLPDVAAEPGRDARAFAEALAALGRSLGPKMQLLRADADRAMRWRADYAARMAAGAPAAPAPAAPPAIPGAASPAAWHPDPWGQARLRWWDGGAWTGYVSD